jgi:putative intracellular protease/amidase
MPGTEKVLAFPVYPGVTPLDLIGPLTVLKTPGIGGTRYRTVVVGERTEPLATDTPLQLQPAATFAEVPNPWAVVVPGGGAATLAATQDEALLSYVRAALGRHRLRPHPTIPPRPARRDRPARPGDRREAQAPDPGRRLTRAGA